MCIVCDVQNIETKFSTCRKRLKKFRKNFRLSQNGKSILKVVISVIRVSMHLKIYDMRESVSDVFVIQCTSIYKKKIFLDCPGSITYGGLFRRPPDSILGERIPHLNCMTKDSLDPYRMFSLSSLF